MIPGASFLTQTYSTAYDKLNKEEVMKRVGLFLFILLIGFSVKAQVQPLGLELENFPYPFPVQYLPLNVQQQNLRMAQPVHQLHMRTRLAL